MNLDWMPEAFDGRVLHYTHAAHAIGMKPAELLAMMAWDDSAPGADGLVMIANVKRCVSQFCNANPDWVRQFEARREAAYRREVF